MGTGNLPGTRTIIDTWANIHLFLVYESKIQHIDMEAKKFDFVWGALPRRVEAIRKGNPDIFLSFYLPFHRDFGSFFEYGAYRKLDYWKEYHPDWILYKSDGKTPAYEFGHPLTPLALTAPELVPWQVQTFAEPASTHGYDAIAADNVSLYNHSGACGFYRDGRWIKRYSGLLKDPQWSRDVLDWLARMHRALHSLAHPLALIPNFSLSGWDCDDPRIQELVTHVDGILDEQGFTKYATGYLTDRPWQQRITFMKRLQEQGKPYYVVNQLASINNADLQWVLASYLMGKGHASSIYISSKNSYGVENWHPEYEASIGYPLSEMYEDQHVYRRDYSKGVCIVNPSSVRTCRITFRKDTRYLNLDGHSVEQTITMLPHSGVVLVSAAR